MKALKCRVIYNTISNHYTLYCLACPMSVRGRTGSAVRVIEGCNVVVRFWHFLSVSYVSARQDGVGKSSANHFIHCSHENTYSEGVY